MNKIQAIIENKEALAAGLLCVYELAVRLAKTERSRSILTGIGKIIMLILPDRKADGSPRQIN
jgi:hypothetical protein